MNHKFWWAFCFFVCVWWSKATCISLSVITEITRWFFCVQINNSHDIPTSTKKEWSTGSSDLYLLLWKLLFLSCISCPSALISVGSFCVLLTEKKRKDFKRVNVKSSLHENRGVFWRPIYTSGWYSSSLKEVFSWAEGHGFKFYKGKDFCTKPGGSGHLPIF